MDKNVEYYNDNAQSFYETTVNVDMSYWRYKFESYVADGGRILDAGCGSGRDSKAFKKHGYSVVAIDASREMCRLASELLDQEVWQMRFDEIAFDAEFDAGMADYLASGGQAIIDERIEKLAEVYGIQYEK